MFHLPQELFRKVIPHHCLGSVWSRRDKKRGQAPSVYATVNHFNAVSYRVVATILKQPFLPPVARVEIIEKWVDIAQVRYL
jgi:ral guanine nucleotide dissociation stimulator-like 1